MADPPKYQAPPPDPAEQQLAQQTSAANIRSTMDDTRMDTARLMAIYGTRLAMGTVSTGGSPLLSAPAAPAVGAPGPGYTNDAGPSGGY